MNENIVTHQRKIRNKVFNICGDKRDKSVFNNVLSNFYYEDNMIDFYEELLKTDSVCIDAGANVGILSIYMSMFTSGKIYAFEPVPQIFEALQKTIESNDMKNVEIFNVALGNKNSKETFSFNVEHNGGCRTLNEFNKGFHVHPLDESIEVNMITLDDFVKDHNVDKLDLLKMDVEGFEQQVFEGGINTIEKFRPDIVSEFCHHMIKDVGLNPEQYFDILKKYYKNIYLIDRPIMQLIRIKDSKQLEYILTSKYHNIGDIFITNKEL